MAGLSGVSDPKSLPGTVGKGFRAPPSDCSIFMLMSHVGGGERECGLRVRAGPSVGERGQGSHLLLLLLLRYTVHSGCLFPV